VAKVNGATKHQIAPRVRGGILGALDIMEARDGVTISEAIYQEMKEKGVLYVLDKAGKYVERITDVNVGVTDEFRSLVDVLTAITEGAGHDTPVESEPGSIRH
jgi:hypothetical protein